MSGRHGQSHKARRLLCTKIYVNAWTIERDSFICQLIHVSHLVVPLTSAPFQVFLDFYVADRCRPKLQPVEASQGSAANKRPARGTPNRGIANRGTPNRGIANRGIANKLQGGHANCTKPVVPVLSSTHTSARHVSCAHASTARPVD
jgi:hypothetical protein